jgi:hypothetical protein
LPWVPRPFLLEEDPLHAWEMSQHMAGQLFLVVSL